MSDNGTRVPWLGTSWKMNKTVAEATAYARTLAEWARSSDVTASVSIFPPFTAISATCEAVGPLSERIPIHVGGQNMHWEDAGSFTGEISPVMLRDAGATTVELGHFERRSSFAETDLSVNRKVRSALKHGLTALICVGDSVNVREYGIVPEFVSMQLKLALNGVPVSSLPDVVIAYEPGWAIGVGGTSASTDEVQSVHEQLRSALRDLYGHDRAQDVRIVYGGSVTGETAPAYASARDIDGLFVGRAASDVSDFISIIETFCAARALSIDNSSEVA